MNCAFSWVVLVAVLSSCLEHVRAFNSIAMSGSGQYMLLASYHNLVSSDYGTTFQQIGDFLTLTEFWYGCAVDESGQHMALGSQLSGVYVSSDFGKSWTKSGASTMYTWGSIVTSVTGNMMVATNSASRDYTGVGTVATSLDAGLTWKNTQAWQLDYGNIVCDTTGQYLTTIAHNFDQTEGILLASDNFGGNWTFVNSAPYDRYYWIAADSTGKRLVITGSKGVHMSADRGVTWSTTPDSTMYQKRVASDATGQYLVAAGLQVYTSADYGQSWMVALNRNDSWTSVATSSDFRVLAAVSGFGVFVSRDSGATWTTPPLATPTPSARPSQKPFGSP